MKNLKNIVSVIVLALVMFAGNNVFGQKNNPLDYVGKLHNKELDNIINEYQTVIKNKSNTIDPVLLISFINWLTQREGKQNNNSYYLDIKQIIGIPPFIGTPPFNPYLNSLEEKRKKTLPSEYKSYAELIYQMSINKDKKGLEQLVKQIMDKIESKEIQNALLGAVSIAYNSIIYWDNPNNVKKYAIFKKGEYKMNKGPILGVAAADAAVALVGIAAGFLTGGIAWAGVGTATAEGSAAAAAYAACQ